jgi:hypothetical protein
MKITKINPRTPLEEEVANTILNFTWLYELLDKRIAYMDNLLEKRFAKRSDKALALEFGLLLHGQKILFQMSEDHGKFIYEIRDIMAEYGNVLEKLSEQIEYLSNELPDKKDAKIFQNHIIELKKQIDSANSRIDKTRESLVDIRNEVEPVVRVKDLFEAFTKKMRENINEEKTDG